MNSNFEATWAAVDAAENELPDNHRNAPRPSPDCLYGIVGDVARAGGDTTEAKTEAAPRLQQPARVVF